MQKRTLGLATAAIASMLRAAAATAIEDSAAWRGVALAPADLEAPEGFDQKLRTTLQSFERSQP